MNFLRPPQLPVSKDERIWIDDALERMTALFGDGTLRTVDVQLPKDETFPEWDGTEACLAPLIARICGCMGTDPNGQTVEILADVHSRLRSSIRHIATGKYTARMGAVAPPTVGAPIAVKETLLQEPIALIATLAHEIGRTRLLEKGVERTEEHLEPLTDICTVFWGLGIFTANSAFRFTQSKEGWSVRRQGYLSEAMWGYALASWAHRRGDREAKWARHLGTNLKEYFTASQKVLSKSDR